MIHGPGNKGNLNLLYKFAMKGIPYPLAAFDNRRSFLSIDNLSFIIEQIVERDDIPGGIYNISDDEPLSTNRIIEIMSEEIGRKPQLWKLSRTIIRCIAQIGDRVPLKLNTDRLKKLTEDYIVNNNKIKAALKTELLLTSEEGIRLTVQSFKNRR